MSGGFITYFGYGSLVNRATRPAGEQAVAARLYGWQRVWGHRVLSAQQPSGETQRSCCSLSVQKLGSTDIKSTKDRPFIDGVVVTIPIANLAELDTREAGYDRRALPSGDFDLSQAVDAEEIYLYQSKADYQGYASEQFPILQSYIDCVMAGYCQVFDAEGMEHFVATTTGWGGVIDNDRHKPKYPRAVNLPADQLARFDDVVTNKRLQVHQENN